ncbi:MAG: TIGR01212 family radical SAM protein [Omnitrophica bacterium]|nr:TIGR01212 family radical SAM protein [Candidatus Omnitrophota bacterium]
MERFYTFNRYLRGIFGERVQRISLDAGFDCPNLDGTLDENGCIYCNNKAFARYCGYKKPLEEQISESIKFYSKKLGVKKYIAYFQSFSNTYAEVYQLRQRYEVIRKFPQIVGLSISTRPDCVDEDKLKFISGYNKDYLVWIEYGLQTTNNYILEKINRCHTYEDFLKAYLLTRKYKINVGVHLILGLPSATYKVMMEDARRISELDIQGLKFHLLHVLVGSKLEELYKQKEVELMSLKEYVRLVCDFLERIPPKVAILRLVSTASRDYLLAPFWMNDKVKVIEEIKKELHKRNSYQGDFCESISCENKKR